MDDRPTLAELRRRVVEKAGSLVANNYHTKLSPKTQRRIEKFLLSIGKWLTKPDHPEVNNERK